MERDAFEFLSQQAINTVNPVVEKIHDDTYVFYSGQYRRIEKYYPSCDPLKVFSLEMLVNMIKQALTEDHEIPLIVNIESNKRVVVESSLNAIKQRETILVANAETPNEMFGLWMSPEEMIIYLMTSFQHTENIDRLTQLLSSIVVDQKLEITDDGFSQKVTTTDGAQIKHEVSISPLAKLIPIRTFTEVLQPETMFLIRINKQGQVSLIDASAGSYVLACMNSIKGYLYEYLEDDLKDGTVILG